MKKLRNIMLGGTGSDVGKSLLAAGLCRIFKQDGYSPAPFKAQNMALNSYVTPDGLEIGRAQAVQAAAAGLECRAEMNPVLLKPSGERRAQVVVMGLPAGNRDAAEYFNDRSRMPLKEISIKAFRHLEENHNPIVMEGAGSVAEMNLQDRDFVNMPMADAVDADVILVADIDRGGVFAQVYGSIMLQPEHYRRRIKGVIINKFRGDIELFRDGRRMIEELCGVPVLGVVPLFRDIDIEDEDSLSVMKRKRMATEENLVNVGVAYVPQISNFTDFDFLSRDPRVHLYFTSDPAELRRADVILLPGSKNTIQDLEFLRERGCDEVIREAVASGKPVAGICGGYQMMGLTIEDPEGVEGGIRRAEGLGLLPVDTRLTRSKTLTRSRVALPGGECVFTGYEIHMGETTLKECASPMFLRPDGISGEGCRVSDRLWGTYMHGILDNPDIIDLLLRPVVEAKGLPAKCGMEPPAEYRERQYDLLASHMREHIDIERLYSIMRND